MAVSRSNIFNSILENIATVYMQAHGCFRSETEADVNSKFACTPLSEHTHTGPRLSAFHNRDVPL